MQELIKDPVRLQQLLEKNPALMSVLQAKMKNSWLAWRTLSWQGWGSPVEGDHGEQSQIYLLQALSKATRLLLAVLK